MSLHLPIKMPPKRTTAVILMPACTQKPGCQWESISLWKAIRGLEKLSLMAILAMDANNDGNTDEKHTVDKLKADIEM